MLDKFDRPFTSTMMGIIPQRIPSASIIKVCEGLGLAMGDFRKLLLIEDKVYPNIVGRYKEAQKQKEGSEVLH